MSCRNLTGAKAVSAQQEKTDMKTRSKIGGRKGSPAFRTPSSFIVRKDMDNRIRKVIGKKSK